MTFNVKPNKPSSRSGVRMGKVENYQVTITRLETVQYIYQLKATSKEEAEKLAKSGEYEHAHFEQVESKVTDVESSKLKGKK